MRDSASAPLARPPPGGHYAVFFGPISQDKYYISQRRCGRKWIYVPRTAEPHRLVALAKTWCRAGLCAVRSKKKIIMSPTCGIIRVICPHRNKKKEAAEVCALRVRVRVRSPLLIRKLITVV